jgi:spore germination protein
MYTAFVMYHYGASLGLGQLFDKRFQGFALAALPVVYFIASWPNNLNRVFKLGDYLGYGSFCVFGVIPILLWIVAVARGIGDGQRKIRR